MELFTVYRLPFTAQLLLAVYEAVTLPLPSLRIVNCKFKITDGQRETV